MSTTDWEAGLDEMLEWNGVGPTASKEIKSFIREVEKRAEERGRVSVLQDFDIVCRMDAIVGFSAEEFAAIKKFFEWNKQISGWDRTPEATEARGEEKCARCKNGCATVNDFACSCDCHGEEKKECWCGDAFGKCPCHKPV